MTLTLEYLKGGDYRVKGVSNHGMIINEVLGYQDTRSLLINSFRLKKETAEFYLIASYLANPDLQTREGV